MLYPPVLLKRILVLTVSVGALALVGCKAAPQTLTQSRAKDAQSSVWTKRGSAGIEAVGRLAIAEASVEFVTSKNEMGESRQAAFIPPHPVFLAANAAGVGRKNVEFDDDAFGRIVSRINAALESEFQTRGWSIVPRSEIVIADAYARFTTLPVNEPREVRQINLAATDTGRVRMMRVFPAQGTSVISEPNGKNESDTRRALLEELGADAVIRVIVRVGVYQGKASLEEGSQMLLTTPEGDATLSASRSLLSDLDVLSEDATDGQLVVSESAYLTAVENAAPVFIRQAIDEMQR